MRFIFKCFVNECDWDKIYYGLFGESSPEWIFLVSSNTPFEDFYFFNQLKA